MVGTTIASTTASDTIAPIVIAGRIKHEYNKHEYNKHEYDKHGRGAGLYFYFVCLYDYYYYCATKLVYNNRARSQRDLPQTDPS